MIDFDFPNSGYNDVQTKSAAFAVVSQIAPPIK
jgi:hypothetical protein